MPQTHGHSLRCLQPRERQNRHFVAELAVRHLLTQGDTSGRVRFARMLFGPWLFPCELQTQAQSGVGRDRLTGNQ
jgi:hypothetical protein